MIAARGYADGTSARDGSDISLDERLAFERLLGDLSALFADIPADRVIDEISGALARLIDFLGFDRYTFGEFIDDAGRLEVLCSVAREGIEITPVGPGPTLPWYLGALQAGRLVVAAAIPEDFPPEAKVEIEYCRRIGLRSNLGIPLRVGGRVMGLIAFTAFHRTRAWPEDLIIRL
ncbi:MAG: GAF domain-containing protein, partial [Thiohalocapsa sp.]